MDISRWDKSHTAHTYTHTKECSTHLKVFWNVARLQYNLSAQEGGKLALSFNCTVQHLVKGSLKVWWLVRVDVKGLSFFNRVSADPSPLIVNGKMGYCTASLWSIARHGKGVPFWFEVLNASLKGATGNSGEKICPDTNASIHLFHTGGHHNSKTRLGWAGATEMFHSSVTMPEASFCPLVVDFRMTGGPWNLLLRQDSLLL